MLATTVLKTKPRPSHLVRQAHAKIHYTDAPHYPQLQLNLNLDYPQNTLPDTVDNSHQIVLRQNLTHIYTETAVTHLTKK